MIAHPIITCQADSYLHVKDQLDTKAKKARIEVEFERVVREEYEHWVSLEKYDVAWFLTYCGTRATESPGLCDRVLSG